nr:integrase, catalytic region, zinc finger, CCHC-type, peptidase aspartic, catalytic [Tanacetum cinerariifolium]
MGTLRETLTEGTEGALYLGPEEPRVYSDLTSEEKDRGHGNNARGVGAAGYGRDQNKVRYANPGRARQIKCYNYNGIGHIDLELNVDNVFQADDCDAFDSNVDEAPTAQTMFMANLSSADPVYDEAGPSYDSNVLSEVENAKVKQHYKELYDSIDSVTPNLLAPGTYAIDVEPIPPSLRNNKEVHLDYLKHLKESVATLHEIVEQAKVERPLDRSVASTYLYTKHFQELLEYVISTCLKDFVECKLVRWLFIPHPSQTVKKS